MELESERVRFRDFISALDWVTGEFEGEIPGDGSARLAPAPMPPGRAVRAGFLIHSLLGAGLRQATCQREPACPGACERPTECVYGRLWEPSPQEESRPLAGVARVPLPLAIDAPWEMVGAEERLRFRLHLMGSARQFQSEVESVLLKTLEAGRASIALNESKPAVTWLEGSGRALRSDLEQSTDSDPAARHNIRLDFHSPLRIVRRGVELPILDLGSLVRDLAFRISVWGRHYQGMDWPSPWLFLWTEARGVEVHQSRMKRIVFSRYSSRQRIRIPMSGLMGPAELKGVTPDLLLLLRLGEICGAGKGASIGLGRYDLVVQ